MAGTIKTSGAPRVGEVREKELRNKEQRIIDAATELFGNQGFHSTSTRKIAEAAGVSEGTVFNYFSNKNELLTAIIHRYYDQLISNGESMLQQEMDTRRRLLRLAENHLRTIWANNALLMRMIQLYFNTDLDIYSHIETTELHQFNLRYSRIFNGIIREGIQRGDLRDDINKQAIRDLFFGGLEYGMRTLAIHHKPNDIENYVAELVSPLWYSIAVKAEKNTPPTNYEQRMEAACLRIEKAASKLEKTSR